MLSKEQITSAADITPEKVDVPEWGGHVFVRGLTGPERDRFQSAIADESGGVAHDRFRVELLVRAICDEAGKAIFDEMDAHLLAGKSAKAIYRLYDVAATLSGIGADEKKS